MPRPAKQPGPAADPGAEPPSPDAASVVQVKVWLLGISPMVWRRLLVPDTCTLRELHGMIQVAMGWEGICTFKQGRIADRGQEAQQFRASGLNLVIAAIVYWNSTYLADAVRHLRDQGRPVPDALLAHTSPLTWEHIGFSGDFLWDRAAATADRRRPLNLGRARMAA